MKVNKCVNCETWWVGFIQLTDEQKNAVIILQSAKIIKERGDDLNKKSNLDSTFIPPFPNPYVYKNYNFLYTMLRPCMVRVWTICLPRYTSNFTYFILYFMELILREPLKNPIESQAFGKDFIWYNLKKGVNEYFYKDTYGLLGHSGIDYRCNIGTPIYAMNDGVCLYAGYDDINGNLVQIWNKEKGFKTLYGHNSELKTRQGDIVKAGQMIALSGNTGGGTGTHSHTGLKLTGQGGNSLDINNGYNGAIDPAPYIKLDYLGNNINDMRFKKIKGEPSVYLVDDIKGTRTMIIDMPTLVALDGTIEEVDNLAGYIDKGTLIWCERVIN